MNGGALLVEVPNLTINKGTPVEEVQEKLNELTYYALGNNKIDWQLTINLDGGVYSETTDLGVYENAIQIVGGLDQLKLDNPLHKNYYGITLTNGTLTIVSPITNSTQGINYKVDELQKAIDEADVDDILHINSDIEISIFEM